MNRNLERRTRFRFPAAAPGGSGLDLGLGERPIHIAGDDVIAEIDLFGANDHKAVVGNG